MSNHAFITVPDALRHRRAVLGTRWRDSPLNSSPTRAGPNRKGETYTDLAAGFQIGTTMVFHYIREALDVLATLAPSLPQAIAVAAGKAFVISTAPAHDQQVDIGSGRNRPCSSGKHKRHGVNVQVLADPAAGQSAHLRRCPAPSTT
jgi:hypothetical protein